MSTRGRFVVLALGVLVVLAAVGVGWLGWRAVGAQRAQDDVDGALAAARSGIEDVFSYDSASLDADITRARGLVTGPFAEQFEDTNRTLILPAAAQGPFSAGLKVTRTALVGTGPGGTVDVLLLADQTWRSVAQPQPEQEVLQVVVTMTRGADGRWLIEQLRPV